MYQAISIVFWAMNAPVGAQLIAARYDNGRMSDVVILSDFKAADTLVMKGVGEQYKLFLVDGTTYYPLCEAWSN